MTRCTLTIGASIERVWFALADVPAVMAWAAVTPAYIPDGYPATGQYALWLDRGVLLHDAILDAQPERRLVSRLARGPWSVIEEYRLRPGGAHTTHLDATWRGHPALADNDAAMARLKKWCERYR